MIGNDIIDLNAASINSRWQEQRFLDKLFTEDEQGFILKAGNRFHTIWLLWSMKESAYKVYARHQKLSSFNPKNFHCSVVSETSGIVCFDNHIVHTTSEFNSDIIYTTAQFPETMQLTRYLSLDGKLKTEKSKELKEKAIQTYADLNSILESSISIKKNDQGVPQFYVNQKLQCNALTLTHHGQYGGLAISY